MLPKPVTVYLQHLLPQHLLSRLAGQIAHIEYPAIKAWIIERFIQHYGVDLSEAIREHPEDYRHFSDFFTRHLKPEARPIAADTTQLISPCDGQVYDTGILTPQKQLMVKQAPFELQGLIGDNQTATEFQNGQYIINYLSPKDYHRVHMPADGQLEWMRYIPGKLFSVNVKSAAHIPNLFSRNERIVLYFNGPKGPFICILVGAFNVGSINTTWAGTVTPNEHQVTTYHYSTETEQYRIFFEKGQEIGFFNFGSTVICLFPHEQVGLAPEMKAGSPLRMGQPMATFL